MIASMTTMPEGLLELLRRPSLCFLATLDPDGSPQLTQTWAGTDGEHIQINTVEGFRKLRNVLRDPRVAVTIADPERTNRYYGVKGRVLKTATDGAADSIESLARKYLGGPYPWYGGRDQVRVDLTIAVDSVIHTPQW
jgi:PPOX class probable F420-dependent enzyme